MEQRVIKFRAWNHSKREWTGFKTCIDTKAFEDGGVMLPFQDVTLMQFTGLKDKNGREVYEGDIVRCSSSKGCLHEIIWRQEYGGVYVGGMPAWYLSDLNDGYAWTGSEEVTGNVFENPELLKQT